MPPSIYSICTQGPRGLDTAWMIRYNLGHDTEQLEGLAADKVTGKRYTVVVGTSDPAGSDTAAHRVTHESIGAAMSDTDTDDEIVLRTQPSLSNTFQAKSVQEVARDTQDRIYADTR